jgi:hypothetical protein
LSLYIEIQEIQKRYSVQCQKITIFKDEFEKVKHWFRENAKQVEQQIADWKISGATLYAQNVDQLIGGRNPIAGPLPDHIWDDIYKRVAIYYLAPFDHLFRTGFHHGKELDNPERLILLGRWSDLMLCFLLDLKKLHILVKPLSRKDVGRFALSYVLAKFPPFDVDTTYLNFDLRSSILEDINSNTLKEICQG